MKLDTAFLRSKVARRIFSLFVLCALVPIAILAFISFYEVTKQLEEQSQTRLQQASRVLGMSIFERLLLLETEMRMLASALSAGAQPASSGTVVAGGNHPDERFKGLEVITGEGKSLNVFGQIRNFPALFPGQRDHLLSDRAVVVSDFPPGRNAHTFLVSAIDPQASRKGILLGEVNAAFLWNPDMVPSQTELCVLDGQRRVLFATAGIPILARLWSGR
jgi:hypothetical protein